MNQCSPSKLVNSTNKEGVVPKILLQEDGSFFEVAKKLPKKCTKWIENRCETSFFGKMKIYIDK